MCADDAASAAATATPNSCRPEARVSGRYYGVLEGTVGRTELDLRVDVEPINGVSPAMNRISGDFFNASSFGLPGTPARSVRTYRESWVVSTPHVKRATCQVIITGEVRFYRGQHPSTKVEITIPWGLDSTGPALVIFREPGGEVRRFSCPLRSAHLRSVNLEVDVCSSVNHAPLLPTYDTAWHSNHPADLAPRQLTIETAYADAGVGITIRPDHTVIDDSSPEFDSWSPAELHDAMESHFSQMASGWPKWELWGIVAQAYEDSGVGGIMFDAPAEVGGAGGSSSRQGFAVFRGHEWFQQLRPGTPATPEQAEAHRKYLYTFVHEAGHAFNFLHSWDKARPDALSWMNYDWKYDQRNGADAFWASFRFRFDDEELIHIRHGDRSSVIMGGDAWASGGHLDSPGHAVSAMDGTIPLELLVRSKGYFDLMEPVNIELRLRNLMPDMPIGINARLEPEHGGVAVLIQGPDGRVRVFEPVMCKLAAPRVHLLEVADPDDTGKDRLSVEAQISYGKDGFYFIQPGEYLVRAIYRGPGDFSVPSNLMRIRVGVPASREEDRTAQDFFSHGVGMSLFLNGSQSPFLKKGMDVLRDVKERFPNKPLAVHAASALAAAAARPFYRLERPSPTTRERRKLVRTHAPAPQQAFELTVAASNVLAQSSDRDVNLSDRKLALQRARYLVAMNEPGQAKELLETARVRLATRGVKAAARERMAQIDSAIVEGKDPHELPAEGVTV